MLFQWEIRQCNPKPTICCGRAHTLVLSSDGEAFAWGFNSCGQIGNGTDCRFQLTPIKVNSNKKVIQISCGGWHSMALRESGSVYGWDSYDFGKLGLNADSLKPSFVLTLENIKFKKISCNLEHSLLLSSDGTIYLIEDYGSERQNIRNFSLINYWCRNT
jgi:alpha-tubulin suppressor-like RCC1 family protein